MNYHANLAHLSSNSALKSIYVMFHIPIPDFTLHNNGHDKGGGDTSVKLRTAVFENFNVDGVVPSIIEDLNSKYPTEYAQLQTGELHEYAEVYKFINADASLVDKRTELRARWTALSVNLVNEYKAKFKFWDYADNVPV